MKRALSLVIASIALSGVAWAGGGAEKAAPSSKVIYSLPGEPQTLDPTLNVYSRSSMVLQNLFRGLYKIDANNKPVPALAEGYTLDDTNTVYTFTIKSGAKWSDGKAVTAADFEYSWKRVLNPETGSEAAFYLYYLKNGKAFNEGKASAADVGVTAVDEKTLKVTLEDPTPYFLDLLCVTAYYPVRKDIVEGNSAWTKDPATYVVTGPFMITQISPKEKYVLKKNPNYVDADKVKLDELDIVFIEAQEAELAAYTNGEIDVADNLSAEAVNKYKATSEFKSIPRIGTNYYDFQCAKKPFDDPRVRKAFAISIDRAKIVSSIVQTVEKPAFGFVPYGIPDGVQTDKQYRDVVGNLFTEDVAAAKKLLADAGYPDGAGLPTLTLICQNDQVAKDTAQALQAAWKQNLGANLEIVTYESKVYWDMVDQGDFNLAADGWTGDYPDPMTDMEIFESQNNKDDNRWANAEYDALLAANRKSSDQKVRMANFAKAEKILIAEMPVMPMRYYEDTFLCKPRVAGVRKSYIGHIFFEDAYIVK